MLCVPACLSNYWTTEFPLGTGLMRQIFTIMDHCTLSAKSLKNTSSHSIDICPAILIPQFIRAKLTKITWRSWTIVDFCYMCDSATVHCPLSAIYRSDLILNLFSLAAMDKTFAVNVKGPALALRNAVPLLKASEGGSVINVSSINGLIGLPGFVPYAASKAAILQLTRNSAVDLGKFNIR